MTGTIQIKLNGETKTVTARTVAELLGETGAPEVGVAVAKNGAVVRKAEHTSTPVNDGDTIEIIRAVQGG
jgi:thiamine biosynthesis protein ThiS